MQLPAISLEADQQQQDLPLDWVSIVGFKSIAKLDQLKLKSLNVLIGANGAGKSNFIGALEFLHSISEGRDHLGQYVLESGGASNLLHFGATETPKMMFGASFGGGTNRYQIQLTPAVDDRLYPSKEEVFFRETDGAEYHENVTTQAFYPAVGCVDHQTPSKRVLGWIRARLLEWRCYHFHDTSASSPVKRTSNLNDNQFLRANGENLAAFLYMLGQHRRQEYDLIVATVQRVMPFIEYFALRPNKENPEWIRLTWKHRQSSRYFDISALPDGGLRFVLLATLFLQPPEFMPGVILVDEPELGLHPEATFLLASLIQQASMQAQVVVATQSSALIDQLSPEDVLVTDQVNGSTEIRRLSTDKLHEWLDEYTLGQIWEGKHLGGVPALA